MLFMNLFNPVEILRSQINLEGFTRRERIQVRTGQLLVASGCVGVTVGIAEGGDTLITPVGFVSALGGCMLVVTSAGSAFSRSLTENSEERRTASPAENDH